jgi:3-methyladenine DNA glycosylase/8-oxoguanine DNA glycosylase
VPRELTRRWRTARPLDLGRTLAPLRHGAGDPCTRLRDGVLWRACRTPDGPGSISIEVCRDEIQVRSWGAGAAWLLGSAPALLGDDDDWSGLDVSGSAMLERVRRRLPGVRLGRTGLVLDSLVPACLEQRVTGSEAWRAWRELVRAYGEPAPGPAQAQLWLPPDPAHLLGVTDWDWHRFGVDRQRWRAIRAVATVATRLEECAAISQAGDWAAVRSRMRVVPGVGEWTAAEVSLRALGDRDAVSVGDFHLKNLVGWVLTGAARSDDLTMLHLLEPWRGQRARVVRLIELSGLTPPKFGPRFSPIDIRAL